MEKKDFLSSVSKIVLPTVAAGFIFSWCQQNIDLPVQSVSKKDFSKKSENWKKISDDLNIENKDSFEICEKKEVIDFSNNILKQQKDVFFKTDSVLKEKDEYENYLFDKQLLEKEKILNFKKNIDKKFNWTLYKILSNKWKFSNLKKIRAFDETVFDNLKWNDLELFNKLNFFREKILEWESILDIEKNISSELNFQYEELKDLIYNWDKIFTEARKVISWEKSKDETFLNTFVNEIKEDRESSWISKSYCFNEKIFSKKKFLFLKKTPVKNIDSFNSEFDKNLERILNSENRYKELFKIRNESGLFFSIDPDSSKDFTTSLYFYLKAFTDKWLFDEKKFYVENVDNNYKTLSNNQKQSFKEWLWEIIDNDLELKILKWNIWRTYNAAQNRYMLSFLDDNLFNYLKKELKYIPVEKRFDYIKEKYPENKILLKVFEKMEKLLSDLNEVFYAWLFDAEKDGFINKDKMFDYWDSKKDILIKDYDFSISKYRTRNKWKYLDKLLTVIRNENAQKYLENLKWDFLSFKKQMWKNFIRNTIEFYEEWRKNLWENFSLKWWYKKIYKNFWEDVFNFIEEKWINEYLLSLDEDVRKEFEAKLWTHVIVNYMWFSNNTDSYDFEIFEKYWEKILNVLEKSKHKEWIIWFFYNKENFVKFIINEIIIESKWLKVAYNWFSINPAFWILQNIAVYMKEYETNPILFDELINARILDLYNAFNYTSLKRYVNLDFELKIRISHQVHNSWAWWVYNAIKRCRNSGDNIKNFHKYIKTWQSNHYDNMKKIVKGWSEKWRYNVAEFMKNVSKKI